MQRLLSYLFCAGLAFTFSCSPSTDGSPSPSGDGGTAGSLGASGAAGQGGPSGAAGGVGGTAGGAGGTSGAAAGTGGTSGTAGTGTAGTGTAGAGTAGAGTAGTGGGGGSAGSSGGSGGRQYSSDPATFFGEPRCTGFAHCESFESTSAGSLPSGFTLAGYGTRTVGAVTDLAARGTHSLRIDVPAQASVTAWLTKASLGALGEAHFGRVFVRISSPAPSEFVHFDLFAGIGPFGGHTNEVRWAVTGTGAGTSQDNWSFIYNVQPSGSGAGPEFGSEGDRSAHPSVGSFMCLEWSFDSAKPEARFFLDGNPIEYLHIDTERSEIPVFDTIAVGFAKYQNTGAFTVHIDEVAFDPERIGCNN